MYKCEIIADSLSPQGNRLTSFLVTYPRIIHAEMLRHRMFSRNVASSRAIPFEKMVKDVEENPFIPLAWQKDHKGMQGSEYITDERAIKNLNNQWIDGRDAAIKVAKGLHKGAYYLEVAKDENGNNMRGFNCVDIPDTSVTKQLCNRLLEPFMWTTELITTSEDGLMHFFELRCPVYTIGTDYPSTFKSKKDVFNAYGENSSNFIMRNEYVLKKIKKYSDLDWFKINLSQAEIHIQKIAEMMYDAYNNHYPTRLLAGEWHIPFNLDDFEIFNLINAKTNYSTKDFVVRTGIKGGIEIEDAFRKELGLDTSNNLRIKIATARCARLSYTTLGDNPKIDYEVDIKRHDKLINRKEWSPLEHCARAMSDLEYFQNVKGDFRTATRGDIKMVNITASETHSGFGWCNNFRGFIQYRYLIENERN